MGTYWDDFIIVFGEKFSTHKMETILKAFWHYCKYDAQKAHEIFNAVEKYENNN